LISVKDEVKENAILCLKQVQYLDYGHKLDPRSSFYTNMLEQVVFELQTCKSDITTAAALFISVTAKFLLKIHLNENISKTLLSSTIVVICIN
jgi:hypothetical protein